MVESGSTAGQVLQKCGRLYNAKPTGLVNIHSCWGEMGSLHSQWRREGDQKGYW
jgi:hypothetical protein